jgi:plastocyanin
MSRLMIAAVLIASHAALASADQVRAVVGAQTRDKGKQALAFLPNELWVHEGDSVSWTFPTDEIHTVTFLRVTPDVQIRPPFQVGCPGSTADGTPYDGTACVNSDILASGPTYTVAFPKAGNFKLVCLVHVNMTGVVHVLEPSEPLPHDQVFYDDQAERDRRELLSDASRLEGRGRAIAERTSENEVTAGIAETVATTGGGVHSSSVMRFLQDRMVVHVGDTVEWTNAGATVNHTVTFGTEPDDPMPPSPDVTLDSDGALHAVIGSPTDSTHSGFLGPAFQDRVGLAQTPLGVARFRVTFTAPGTFRYICALHDELGMLGTVIVRP